MDPYWIRIAYKKVGQLRYLSHLDMLALLERALRRSGLPLWWRRGFNPRPRISAGPALPLGFESEGDHFAFALEEPLPAARVEALLTGQLPRALELVAVELGRDVQPPPIQAWRLEFGGEIPTAEELHRRLAALGAVTDARGRTLEPAAAVRSLTVAGRTLHLALGRVEERPVRPDLVVAGLGLPAPLRTIKTAAEMRSTDTRTNTKEYHVTQIADQRIGSGRAPDRRGGERASPGNPHLQSEP